MTATGERLRGRLTDWDDDRGFGFIAPADGGPRVFVHVSAAPRGRRPAAGDEVSYAPTQDERGRPRAASVRYVDDRGQHGATSSPVHEAVLVTVTFFAVLAGLVLLVDVSPWVPVLYAVASLIAFFAYAQDKAAARAGGWRTSEQTLHGVALIGGWPGALVARQVLRHKTTKEPFRSVFWLTVLINCAALAGWTVVGPDVLLPLLLDG